MYETKQTIPISLRFLISVVLCLTFASAPAYAIKRGDVVEGQVKLDRGGLFTLPEGRYRVIDNWTYGSEIHSIFLNENPYSITPLLVTRISTGPVDGSFYLCDEKNLSNDKNIIVRGESFGTSKSDRENRCTQLWPNGKLSEMIQSLAFKGEGDWWGRVMSRLVPEAGYLGIETIHSNTAIQRRGDYYLHVNVFFSQQPLGIRSHRMRAENFDDEAVASRALLTKWLDEYTRINADSLYRKVVSSIKSPLPINRTAEESARPIRDISSTAHNMAQRPVPNGSIDRFSRDDPTPQPDPSPNESRLIGELEKLKAQVLSLQENQDKKFQSPTSRLEAVTLAVAPRKALVIGNDRYQHVSKLANAGSDAKAVSDVLSGLGYIVTLKQDVGLNGFKKTLREFRANVNGGDEVLFYYAGHGVQLGSANYLLPVDIKGDSEEQVRDDAVELQRVLDDLKGRSAKFTLAIVDACRDNPFKTAGRAIGGRGLAPTTAATGQMIMFSAGAGQQALDKLSESDKEGNGLFTRVLLKEMVKPNVPVDRVLRSVRNEVVRLSRSVGKEQTPALYDQSDGDFYFKINAAR